MSHTPGPWKWYNYPDGRKLLTARDKAVIHCPDGAMTCDLADQALIAASPKLLAACKAWLEFFEGLDKATEEGDPLRHARYRVHGERIKQSRAAIAEAEEL